MYRTVSLNPVFIQLKCELNENDSLHDEEKDPEGCRKPPEAEEERRGNEEHNDVQDNPDENFHRPQCRVHHDARVGVLRGTDGEQRDHHVENSCSEGQAEHERPRHTRR